MPVVVDKCVIKLAENRTPVSCVSGCSNLWQLLHEGNKCCQNNLSKYSLDKFLGECVELEAPDVEVTSQL